MSENLRDYYELSKKGEWIPAFLKEGDVVGIVEPNLYTGVGVVKEKDRGKIVELLPHLQSALVEYPQGRLMIFLKDLLFYGRKEICPLCRGSKKIFQQPKRTIGYTLTPGETIDEKIIPCPLCSEEEP
jgi:hypothetical protein